jgi:hypothetical protein
MIMGGFVRIILLINEISDEVRVVRSSGSRERALAFVTIFLSVFIAACGPSAEEKEAMEKCRKDLLEMEVRTMAEVKHTFDAPFPKRNRNLERLLGDTIEIDGPCYPLTLQILSTRKSNMIINLTDDDTIFKGSVCKYRDLYYFNEKINDTCYHIFALKLTADSLYGFLNYLQYAEIDKAIEQGTYSKLVKYRNKNSIRLHPDKRELRKLFNSVLYRTPAFAIIKKNTTIIDKEEEVITAIEADDYELISNVYPNPAIDILNIDLQQQQKNVPYSLVDLQGKKVLQGQLPGVSNKIDIGHLTAGTYLLNVGADQQIETIKVVKVK